MIDTLKNLNPVPPIKKAWRWVKDRWPWGRRQVEVIEPDDIELVPIPPPTLRVEIIPPVFSPSSPIHALDVDTQLKRMSVLATRYGRLPFGRRFTIPSPDGAIAQGDRQMLGGVYSGIAAGEPPDTPAASSLVEGRSLRRRCLKR